MYVFVFVILIDLLYFLTHFLIPVFSITSDITRSLWYYFTSLWKGFGWHLVLILYMTYSVTGIDLGMKYKLRNFDFFTDANSVTICRTSPAS